MNLPFKCISIYNTYPGRQLQKMYLEKFPQNKISALQTLPKFGEGSGGRILDDTHQMMRNGSNIARTSAIRRPPSEQAAGSLNKLGLQ